MRRRYRVEEPAGSHARIGLVAGVVVGALSGVLIFSAAGGFQSSGYALLWLLLAYGVLFGGLAGGFVGIMLSRGGEDEAADFYDQAIEEGEILVVVDCTDAPVIAEEGSQPISLRS